MGSRMLAPQDNHVFSIVLSWNPFVRTHLGHPNGFLLIIFCSPGIKLGIERLRINGRGSKKHNSLF